MTLNDTSRSRWKDLLRGLGDQRDIDLSHFLKMTGVPVEELYRGRGGWTALRRDAGHVGPPPEPGIDTQLGRSFGRMLHIDDDTRLSFLANLLDGQRSTDPRAVRLLAMLDVTLWGGTQPVVGAEGRLAQINRERASELKELVGVLRSRIRAQAVPAHPVVPLCLHARYSKNEILAAFGMDRPASWVAGVRYIPEHKADVFFVTVDKPENAYSESTRYRDHAIDNRRFHWESQSVLRQGTTTANRYIRGESTVHLFIRRSKKDSGFGAPPYLYAGPMTYVSHESERPIRFVWQLENPLPSHVHQYAATTE